MRLFPRWLGRRGEKCRADVGLGCIFLRGLIIAVQCLKCFKVFMRCVKCCLNKGYQAVFKCMF